MRGGHALVEVGVGGTGRERMLERVEYGQQRRERGATALQLPGLPLARRPSAEVVEVGAELEIALLCVDGRPVRLAAVLRTPHPLGVPRLDGFAHQLAHRRPPCSMIATSSSHKCKAGAAAAEGKRCAMSAGYGRQRTR